MDERVSMAASRPDGPPVNVLFDLAVLRLLEFDQMSGIAKWNVYYRLLWNDERLAFNGTKAMGSKWRPADTIPFDTSQLWTPDVVPFRGSAALDSPGCYVYDESYLRTNGHNVMWSRPGDVTVHCSLDLKTFPFDTQKCTLVVGPWADRSYSLRAYREGNTTSPFAGSFDSEEWEVKSTFMTSVSKEYMQGRFEEVHYTMVFSRYPHYYLVNAVLPMALVVILSTLTMWLPIEGGSGERLGFSVTLLLTIMATALFTAEHRPATRDDTWMDRYQACCLCLTFFPVLESVLVVWLQYIFEKVSSGDTADSDGGSEVSAPSPRHSQMSAEDSLQKRRMFGKTVKSLADLSSAVRSKRMSAVARKSMDASFRMRLIVYWMRKAPSLEFLLTCRRGRDRLNPRSIDMACRYGIAVVAFSMGVRMMSEVPDEARSGVSVSLLSVPLVTAMGFYTLTALLSAAFLAFRISVLCSERQVERARARRRQHRDLESLEVEEDVAEFEGDVEPQAAVDIGLGEEKEDYDDFEERHLKNEIPPPLEFACHQEQLGHEEEKLASF